MTSIPAPPRQASPQTLLRAAAEYRTCEFVTLTRDGTPIAWPAVCLIDPDSGDGPRITLTTSVALPRKAVNVRRDPRVALLFSDPTGAGRDDLPQVLVQGTATCPEVVHTSPEGLEEYWLQVWERQPDAVDASSALTRWLMDFYYLRLVITVTPDAVTAAAPLRRTGPVPAAGPAPERGDHGPWAEAVRRLHGYPDAVLATAPVGELPALRRVRVTPDAAARRLVLEPLDGGAPAAEPVRGGLLFHGHDDRIGALRQFGVAGTVSGADGRWILEPDRFVPGSAPESPLAMVSTVRRLRRVARRYLDDRALGRPRVDWEAFRALQATGAAGAQPGEPFAAGSRITAR
jgi:hypothetical protein